MVRAALFGMILTAAAAGIAASMPQDEKPPERREGGGDRPRGMMMGPASMVVHKDHIFILQGPTLYKVDPNEMKIVAELQVFKPKGEGQKQDQDRDRDK